MIEHGTGKVIADEGNGYQWEEKDDKMTFMCHLLQISGNMKKPQKPATTVKTWEVFCRDY